MKWFYQGKHRKPVERCIKGGYSGTKPVGEMRPSMYDYRGAAKREWADALLEYVYRQMRGE